MTINVAAATLMGWRVAGLPLELHQEAFAVVCVRAERMTTNVAAATLMGWRVAELPVELHQEAVAIDCGRPE